MARISIKNVSIAFGGDNLLDDVSLEIHPGDRIGLLGRNGTGKTTLLKLICGDLSPDSGEVSVSGPIRMARLPQDVPSELDGTVYDVTAQGLGTIGRLLAEHRALSTPDADGSGTRLAHIEARLNEAEGWQGEQRIERVLTRLELNAETPFATLSTGLKRRALLARALVADPDVLLLDEPTNHLDIAAIDLLEEALSRHPGVLIFVTHDRAFLETFARRIVEIDRGRATAFSGGYSDYLRRRSERDAAEETQNAVFDKKLAKEEAWLRQGLKARRTRNMGRVRALERMRELRRTRRERIGSVSMQIQEASRSGKLVVAAEEITYRWQGRPVIQPFSCMIVRGDKVGIVGPNGAGKTTLLRLLLGTLSPDSGRLRHGTRLEPAYFDQLRDTLDPDRSVADNLADGKDRVDVGGRSRHVIGYLQEFLFTPERARSPVRILSGGECNRLLLARLFARPSNVLVMDEPTNDLDIETLELLEERLIDYPGTLLLVSHDRAFLNNVVTSTLVLDGAGRVDEFVGGYDDWIRQRPSQTDGIAPRRQDKKVEPRTRPRTRPKKRGFNETRELASLPERIEALEREQAELYRTLSDPSFYQQEGEAIAEAKQRLTTLEAELNQAYERWEVLESLE